MSHRRNFLQDLNEDLRDNEVQWQVAEIGTDIVLEQTGGTEANPRNLVITANQLSDTVAKVSLKDVGLAHLAFTRREVPAFWRILGRLEEEREDAFLDLIEDD